MARATGADVLVIGGSGLTELLPDAEPVAVETPYGEPSASPTVAELDGRRVAFLPRHGAGHRLPPHRINYRANIWAAKALGAQWVIGPCAAGSLQPHVAVGDIVVVDQYVDRTHGRADTFFDGSDVVHIASAEPYSPVLRGLLADGCRALGMSAHERGTMVVVQGPRFSTTAESRWYSSMGWEVINMTGYPEAALAREAELAYASAALITDYDCGLADNPDVAPVSGDEIARVFAENIARVRELIGWVIARLPDAPDPHCAKALEGARL